MMTNTNPETGIRYSVIAMNSLDPDTADWLWTEGTNVSEEEAYAEAKAEIRGEIMDEIAEGELDIDPMDEDEIEQEVDYRLEGFECEIDEPYIEGECEGVRYGISWLGGAPNLWVFFSPHISRFKLCSPCCPNACDGDSPDAGGYEGYDVPLDWRDKEN